MLSNELMAKAESYFQKYQCIGNYLEIIDYEDDLTDTEKDQVMKTAMEKLYSDVNDTPAIYERVAITAGKHFKFDKEFFVKLAKKCEERTDAGAFPNDYFSGLVIAAQIMNHDVFDGGMRQEVERLLLKSASKASDKEAFARLIKDVADPYSGFYFADTAFAKKLIDEAKKSLDKSIVAAAEKALKKYS